MAIGIYDAKVADTVLLISRFGGGLYASMQHCLINGIDIRDADKELSGIRAALVFAEVQ